MREICSRCKSDEVMPRVRLVAREPNGSTGRVMAVVDRKPQAWLFKGGHREKLYARLCGQCGFAELFVENPQDLYGAYKQVEPQ